MFSKNQCDSLLRWYNEHKRSFPWRTNCVAPYESLISEFMLQQTTTTTVIPYFKRFLQTFPVIEDLAKASLNDVMLLWQGLGYYRRARYLHECAKIIKQTGLPHTYEEWKKLPGVGVYMAAMLHSLINNGSFLAIDAHVKRILSRVFEQETIKVMPYALDQSLRASDVNQALMDLGTFICIPKNPKCCTCPLSIDCLSYQRQTQHNFPIKKIKKTQPVRYATLFIYQNAEKIILQKRPSEGIWANLYTFPITNFYDEGCVDSHPIKHIFSHFRLQVHIKHLRSTQELKKHLPDTDWIYIPVQEIKKYPLCGLSKKIAISLLNIDTE